MLFGPDNMSDEVISLLQVIRRLHEYLGKLASSGDRPE